MPTISIYGGRMVYVVKSSPSSTFVPGSIMTLSDYYSGAENRAFMAFDIPETIKRKKILSGSFHVYAKSDERDSIGYSPANGQYHDDITWNNQPYGYYNYSKLGEGNSFSWKSISYASFWKEPEYKAGSLEDLLRNGVAFYIWNFGVGQIYTPYSSYRPYISVQYEPITLEASGWPSSGFVDRHKEIKLVVTASPMTDDVLEQPVLKSAAIEWRDGETGDWNRMESQAPASKNRIEFVIPPGSVSAPVLQWRLINVVSNDDVTAALSTMYSLSTVDSGSSAIPTDPVSATVDVESENRFYWQHVIETGSDPTGYDLEYSTDGVVWQVLSSMTKTSATSCIVPAGALPAGKLWWRVRTYNGDGIPGEWSEPAAIIGYGAPPAPVISEITNSARPMIRWQSATQIAYELVIRQGDAEALHVGETAGTEKNFMPADFLDDGGYTVSIRVKNSGQYWSAWANCDFAIQTEKPDQPQISGAPVENGVMVLTDAEDTTLYLLRDGVPIAKIYAGQAIDRCAVGPHEYIVRRVNAAGAFADSAPLVLETKIEQAVIAPADDPGQIIGPLLQAVENEYPSTTNLSVELKFYAGRKYPVAVTDGAINEEYAPVFAALNDLQWRALRRLMEEAIPVIYRNSAGDCACCVITDINPTKTWNGYMTWEITMPRVDYVERIDYDGVV